MFSYRESTKETMAKTPKRITLEPQTPDPSGSNVDKPMSSTLRERLKKTRRSFTSPLNVVKRLRIDEGELPQTLNNRTNQGDECKIDENRNETTREDCFNRFASPQSSQCDLLEVQEKLKKEVKEKSETLRRLKMVKMYRTKNDLTQLKGLIDKWRQCAQTVLYELQTELPTDGHKVSLSQIIDHFGLEDDILHYDRTEEDFRDS